MNIAIPKEPKGLRDSENLLKFIELSEWHCPGAQ